MWRSRCGDVRSVVRGRGAGLLERAVRLYPKDQGAHFNLGIHYGAMGIPDEIAEYKKTLEIDEDYVPAYLNWGAALYAKGEYDEAIQIYRKGILINPLNASLHYSLSVAVDKISQKQEAAAEQVFAARSIRSIPNSEEPDRLLCPAL